MSENSSSREETKSIVEKYIHFVNKTVERFEQIGNLVVDDKITPTRVNTAMGHFFKVNNGLLIEYQRAKIEHADLQIQFKKRWDKLFTQAKQEVIASYEDTKIKPSVTEFEVQARQLNDGEYYTWQEKLILAEAEEKLFLRMIDTLEKYDKILSSLSSNMKSEMKHLDTDLRMSFEPKYDNRKISRRFD